MQCAESSCLNCRVTLKTEDMYFLLRVCFLLPCGKHLYDRIIALRGEVWNHKASLILPLFGEVRAPCLEGKKSSICERDVDFFLCIYDLSVRF